jgi:hypothetical protein
MKKQINSTIKAHLIRGACCLLLVLAVCAIPFAMGQRNSANRTELAVSNRPNSPPKNFLPRIMSPSTDTVSVPAGEICTYVINTGTGTIVPGTTDTGNHCDDCTTSIALPFPITFYDQTFTSANVSSNGNFQFTSDNPSLGSICLPSPDMDNLIAPYWTDLYTADPASGQGIFTSVSGTAPNRVFNIEFREEFCCSGGPPILHFEIRLHEDSPNFEVIYGDLSGNAGEGATVGVQQDTGSSYTAYSCDGSNLFEGLQLSYTLECIPTPPPVPCGTYLTSTSTGKIAPGTTDTGNHCDDCTTSISFPFPVSVYGQFFLNAAISSNGNLQFRGNSSWLGIDCPLPDFGLDQAIILYQNDLITDQAFDCSAFQGGCGVFTSVTGTAPDRVFNIEWRAALLDGSGTANFEVQFFESDPSFFNIIYGSTADNGANEESGIQLSFDGPATTFSCFEPTLTPGLKVTYTCARAPRPTPTPRPRPTPPPRPLPPPPAGETLYAVNGNSSGRGALVLVDQTNGIGTLIGTPVQGVGLSGIAFHPDGRLFATTVTTGNPSTLIQVNPDTGALIATIGVISDNGTPISIGDLSFQPGTGVLYGITSNTFSAGGFLYTINLSTAAATLIGDTGIGASGGLGFAPNGTLYQLAGGSVNVISPVDAHVISSVSTDQFYDGLGVRSDGALFASTGGGTDTIYIVNPATGQSTFIGNTGQGGVSDLDFRRSTARLTSRRSRHSNR